MTAVAAAKELPVPTNFDNPFSQETPEADPEEASEADELLPAAVDVILDTKQASVSMLQRRLKLGYARAARIVDEMEERGIVGPFMGSNPREILITREQWLSLSAKDNFCETTNPIFQATTSANMDSEAPSTAVGTSANNSEEITKKVGIAQEQPDKNTVEREINTIFCRRCGRDQVFVQVVPENFEAKTIARAEFKFKGKHHGFIWWLCIGWWWRLFALIFWICTLPFQVLAQRFKEKKCKQSSAENQIRYQSVCVCKSCGYNWKR